MKTNKKENTVTENFNEEFTLGFCPRSLMFFTQFALLAKRHEDRMKSQALKTASKLATVILFIFLCSNLNAQEEKTRPFQMSFVTPLGTNGLESWNITNKVSINLYAGYNGGLNGFELSGFGGMLKNDMTGTQIAGFGNIVMGKGKGFQGAGFFNYVHNDFKGTQLAGFANAIKGNSNAWQLAGFTNYSKGNTVGQASGFANVNDGSLKGFQLAGFANVNTDTLKGIQVAGFSNYTKTLKGVQIAPFNYIDSLESGIPIGVFSWVNNGYRTFEISTSETLYGVTSFKTGISKFYNIISIGASYNDNQVYWGWGYGLGSRFELKKEWALAVELLSYHINEDEWFTDAVNMHNKLQLTASKKVSKNIELFGGASWNVNVSKLKDSDGDSFKSTFTPYDTFNETYDNDVNVKMYPGFTAGIRF